jgi:penicillin-binding protein 1A
MLRKFINLIPLLRRKPRRRKKSKTLGGRLFTKARFMVLFFILPIAGGILLGGFMAFARTVPSIVELKQEVIPPGSSIFADDDTLIGELKVRKGEFVPISKMPPDLINAIVATEDQNFWDHGGIDFIAIIRAAVTDLVKARIVSGASTLTMQLAKNTFLSPERKLRRKLKEVVLSYRIERSLTKEEILEMYLNRIYLGKGAYGVEMASHRYFDKSVRDLTLPEAAMLAGLPKAPTKYSPFNNFQKAKDRQEVVLRRMEEEGYISHRQRLNAVKASIFLSDRKGDSIENNYFMDYVKNYLVERYGHEQVYRGGMRVYTTMNKRAQEEAQLAIRQGLRDLDKRRGFRGPIAQLDLETEAEDFGKRLYRTTLPAVGDIMKGLVMEVEAESASIKVGMLNGTLSLEDARWAENYVDWEELESLKMEDFSLNKIINAGDVIWVGIKALDESYVEFTLEQEPRVQGALVSIEPYSGFIRAIVGGYDFGKSQYNRALSASRQAGSAFKPMIYALALENGFTPASIIVDEEIEYESINEEGKEEIWKPQNYSEKYYGPTTLRNALVKSRNVVTVKLVDILGVDRVTALARKMGITCEMPANLTVALGSMSITPIELTSAYGAFANRGMRMKPIGIKYITDRTGGVLETNEPEGVEVVSPQTAFLMTSILSDTVQRGTGWRAKALRRPVGGKTGTTNDYLDAWFLGYTTDLMTGVWVGFDEPTPMGPFETGSRAAAPIWVEFMKTFPRSAVDETFPEVEGLVTRIVDPKTGKLANKWTDKAYIEYFVKGTEPKEMTTTIWETQEQDPFFSAP